MKVRIKFSKEGPVRFVGHLDTMRYFQKAVRRAELPAAFSGGYSPHMIMSFAAPLAVGTESSAEYFDLEMAEEIRTDEMLTRLNREMAEGFQVLGIVQVPDGKKGTAMSLVAAADYLVRARSDALFSGLRERIPDFLAQPEIMIQKETKKGVRVQDIRPNIYRMEYREEGIFYRLASASANYTRPELVTDAFLSFAGRVPDSPFPYRIRRLEVYGNRGDEENPLFLPLDAYSSTECR